jgi:predicted O-methyltransferase YrrM
VGSFYEIKSYIKHALRSKGKGGHGIHSPWVYELITQVLHRDKSFYFIDSIEEQRKALLRNTTRIELNDLGAGSHATHSSERSISQIASSALQPQHHAQAIAKMVHRYHPEKILELGTSLGITTAYLKSANPSAEIYTLEGDEAIGNVAKGVWETLGLNGVELVQGNIDETLGHVLKTMQRVDFALLDANHRYEPTMRYFGQLLPYCHEHTILILDDIHWSEEMNRAWQEIIQHPEITISIDFFHFGLLHFRKGKEKENFIIPLP